MRSRWLSRRAVGFHFLLVFFVTVCLVAGWWQLHQALAGNSLSWAYTVEWPVFAVIAVLAWWHLIHETVAERAERAAKADQAGDPDGWEQTPGVDADRVAAAARHEYDAHLARLAARDEDGLWRDPKARS